MQSKFQARLLSHAVTYFTQTNTSQLANQNAASTLFRLAGDFLWQQSRYAQNLYTGRSSGSVAYSHHGPDGLERACALLKHFKLISDDNMNLLKHALSSKGDERTLHVDMILKGNPDNDIDEGQDTIVTQWNITKKDSNIELPNFTTEDTNQLLSFINNDSDILDSTFGQIVFSAAFSNLGVFPGDVTSTQARLDREAQEPGAPSDPAVIMHRDRADCHLLHQKIKALSLKSQANHSSSSNNNVGPTCKV